MSDIIEQERIIEALLFSSKDPVSIKRLVNIMPEQEDIFEFWNNLKNTFSDIKFSIEHVGYLEEPDKNPKASIRWFLEGIHSKDTLDFGEKSNKNIFIMGINHAEIIDGNVIREWVLFDEVAIWKQILMK